MSTIACCMMPDTHNIKITLNGFFIGKDWIYKFIGINGKTSATFAEQLKFIECIQVVF